jgi:RimK family alpha-L-glutamate ligase
MRVGIIAHRASETNLSLAASSPAGVGAFLVAPGDALRELGPADAALGRLDVLSTLEGIEHGLPCLELLELRGIPVLNPPISLRLAHDKLATSAALSVADLPHPRTRPVFGGVPAPLPFPLVLKPRFGSWGRDVVRCADEREYELALECYRMRPWFHAAGAVAQELLPLLGHDLRLVVAAGEVIGAVRRVAAPGEWRTNIALGARRERAEPAPAACELAVAAAKAIGGDLVGVDLLPLGPGRFAILEVNGAVDFSPEYGSGVFTAAMEALVGSLRRRQLLPPLAEAAGW